VGGDIYELNFVVQITEQVSHAKQTSHTISDRHTDRKTDLNLLLCFRCGRNYTTFCA
jgi:hypothetical protein